MAIHIHYNKSNDDGKEELEVRSVARGAGVTDVQAVVLVGNAVTRLRKEMAVGDMVGVGKSKSILQTVKDARKLDSMGSHLFAALSLERLIRGLTKEAGSYRARAEQADKGGE